MIMCLNFPFEVKNQLIFYKVRYYIYIYIYIYMYISYSVLFCCSFLFLRIFEALQMFFRKFLLKWGKNEEDFESSIFFEAQKYFFVFESWLNFFSNCHFRNVVSAFPTLWRSALKMTTWFRRCVTLFSSVQRWKA